ncbi:hypothetical protein HYU92_01270 [Candidatus Curtissbacteria bacterium]|nr:hypothetical protein [Candidatus Curtissbacteria bacterium]
MSKVDLRKILKKHKSGWLALTADNKKEVASAKTLREVLSRARAKGVERPSVLKVPKLDSYYVG